MNTLIQLSNSALNNLEIELLLYCSRIHLDSQACDRIKTLVRQKLDWDYLVEIANFHQIIQIVYHNLSQVCPESLTQNVLSRLKTTFQTNALYDVYLTQELLQLVKLFEQNQIVAFAFKGPVLAVSAYGNLELRQYTDIDFLVQQDDFDSATDLLLNEGYELDIQVPWEYHLVKNNYCSVDLHRYIVPQHLSCSLSVDYIWNNLDSLMLWNQKVPVLAPEVELLMLCLNGTKECWRNFNRICDVNALIYAHPELDWSEIMQQARKCGFRRAILLGILLAKNFLGTAIPEAVWQQIQSDSLVNSLFDEVSEHLFLAHPQLVGEVERTVFHIRTRERWRDKINSFIGLLNHSGWITPTEEDRRNFPALPKFMGFVYYLIRPIRVLNKYGLNTLKRLFFYS